MIGQGERGPLQVKGLGDMNFIVPGKTVYIYTVSQKNIPDVFSYNS